MMLTLIANLVASLVSLIVGFWIFQSTPIPLNWVQILTKTVGSTTMVLSVMTFVNVIGILTRIQSVKT
jgi:hypothetical protein